MKAYTSVGGKISVDVLWYTSDTVAVQLTRRLPRDACVGVTVSVRSASTDHQPGSSSSRKRDSTPLVT